MLRNALTNGFNDALLSYSNKRFKSWNFGFMERNAARGILFPDLAKQENDHDDIYYPWFIVNQLNHLDQENPIICEPGSGYSGLA